MVSKLRSRPALGRLRWHHPPASRRAHDVVADRTNEGEPRAPPFGKQFGDRDSDLDRLADLHRTRNLSICDA